MSNKIKDIEIKNHLYYFCDDFDPNNIKIDENSYKNIFIYYIGYVTIKDPKYIKLNNVNPLCLIFSKLNGYFEEVNKSRYLTLVPTNESKEKVKKYEELWRRIRDLILTKNLDEFDKKYM